jgi:hypothetical protein
MITGGGATMSGRIGFAYQILLLIGMISLRARFPYLACLCWYFLLVDIWFLGNPAWCEEQPQSGHEIYTGLGP